MWTSAGESSKNISALLMSAQKYETFYVVPNIWSFISNSKPRFKEKKWLGTTGKKQISKQINK